MDDTNNFILEAKRLLKLIDINNLRSKEDTLFVLSMQNRVNLHAEVTRKQIFWLRDIKDRQLGE